MKFLKGGRGTVDMINGPMLGPLIRYSIPIMLSGLLQLLFNAADVAVVGRFAGDNALAAVGSTTSLCSLITNVFIGLSVGANVAAARALGAGDGKTVSKAVHTSMLVAVLSGVLLTLIGVIFAPVFLDWMDSPDGVIQPATVYLRIYFCGMVPSMVYNFGSALVRSAGDTRRPFVYLTIAGALNLLLNLVFVIGFGMDVDGVALATVISQCVSAALMVRHMLRMPGDMRLEIKKLRISVDQLISIVRIGLPAGVQSMVSAGSNVLIQSTINSFGAVVVAGNSAASNVGSFVHIAMSAFYQSAISFSSQNCGAKKYDRVWKLMGCAFGCVGVIGIFGGISAWYFGETLLSLFTASDAVIAAGMVLMAYQCIPFVICGLLDTTVGCLRGVGSSFIPMLITTAGICGFRILWIFTVCRMPGYAGSIDAVYISYPISWVITLVAQLAFFAWSMRRLRMNAVK